MNKQVQRWEMLMVMGMLLMFWVIDIITFTVDNDQNKQIERLRLSIHDTQLHVRDLKGWPVDKLPEISVEP